MKHVLLVHQVFVSPRDAGGTRHYEFSRLLARTGRFHFVIIASTLSYLTGKPADADADRDLDAGVNVLRAYTPAVLHRSFVWRVIAFLSFMVTSVWISRRAGPVDVVMGTTPPIFQSVSAWFIALIRRKPFLLEVRDLWPEFAIDMGVLKNPLLIRLSRALESFLYARADHILVNSPAYRDYMLKRGIPASKVTLISNGVDPAMFDPNASGAALRERLGLGDKFVVTYAGALGLANDIGTILRAAQLLKDDERVHFLIVGDGKERPALETLAQTYGLKNITFTGALPKAEMPGVMAASDVCTATLMNIPMFRTTYPNKVFDYMAAAKPVILGIDGVIRAVIEASQGGVFVTPGDEHAFAEAVRTLQHDPARLAQMGQSGRAYVSEHFNRQIQVQEFGTLLERLSARK